MASHVNGERLRVGKTIVATGASAALPSIPGIEDIDYLTSTTALEVQALPRSMLVIGGGYIGCELAQLFARAGVRVTLVCRSRLLPEGEPEIGEALAGYFGEEGIDVRTRRRLPPDPQDRRRHRARRRPERRGGGARGRGRAGGDRAPPNIEDLGLSRCRAWR